VIIDIPPAGKRASYAVEWETVDEGFVELLSLPLPLPVCFPVVCVCEPVLVTVFEESLDFELPVLVGEGDCV